MRRPSGAQLAALRFAARRPDGRIDLAGPARTLTRRLIECGWAAYRHEITDEQARQAKADMMRAHVEAAKVLLGHDVEVVIAAGDWRRALRQLEQAREYQEHLEHQVLTITEAGRAIAANNNRRGPVDAWPPPTEVVLDHAIVYALRTLDLPLRELDLVPAYRILEPVDGGWRAELPSGVAVALEQDRHPGETLSDVIRRHLGMPSLRMSVQND